MRRELSGLLALSLMMTACQAIGTPTSATRTKRVTPAATAQPSARPSTAATPTKPVASPGAGGGAILAPSEPTMALKGLLKMDASYVIAAGGGNVIAAGGGNVIAAGGGNVIAAGGGNLIKVGGQVIAAGGGNVIAAGGGNFRLLANTVAFGEMLPAAGMVVVPVSLRTGKPLGEAVLTDEEGRYTLQIPESESGNVRLVAAVPGKSADDEVLDNPRLRSELLTAAKRTGTEAELVVDDDRAVTSRYFRQAFKGRMAELLLVERLEGGSSSGNPLFDQVWNKLMGAVVAAKTHQLPEARRQALAEQLTDNLIYYVDFSTATVDTTDANWPDAKPETSMEAYTDIIRSFRLAAIAKMAAKSDYFDEQPYLVEANASRPAGERYAIRKATDLGDFVVAEYLTVDGRQGVLKDVFESLGIERKQANRLEAAEKGLHQAMGLTLVTNPKALATLLELVEAAK